MSNQNRKRRVRARMQATGQKYTSAARDQETRESLRSPMRPPTPSRCSGGKRATTAEDPSAGSALTSSRR